jgi:hypothetical protein
VARWPSQAQACAGVFLRRLAAHRVPASSRLQRGIKTIAHVFSSAWGQKLA